MSRWTMPLAAALGVLLGAVGMLWWQANFVGGADRGRIERVVHDYVLAHPEIIPQAMQALQEREAGAQVAANRAAIETPVGSAWEGNPRGDVTLVEYFDYNCGFCRASLPAIRQLIADDPKLRVVYRELPVLAPTSRDAAEVSLAAAAQGKFTRFHDALYAGGPVSAQTIAAAARTAGVDPGKRFAGTDEELRGNLAMAGRLGMTGTPSWVVGDRVLIGALGNDQLKAAIAAARAR